MQEAHKITPGERVQPVYEPIPQPQIRHIPSYEKGYRDGFHEGYMADKSYVDSTIFFGFGLLLLVLAFILIVRHFYRLMLLLCPQKLQNITIESKKLISFIGIFVLAFSLSACAGKQDTLPSPVPVTKEADSKQAEKEQTLSAHEVGYNEDDKGQYVTITQNKKASAKASSDDPKALASLLEMKGVASNKQESAVMQMRPKAIEEAAQLVTFQTAIAHRYKELLAATESHHSVMDTAFNFAPLLMTHGDTLIMPPVLAKAEASMRLEDGATATTAKTTYELLEPARYVSIVPDWRSFLFIDAFPKAEEPHPAVLPKNNKERAIWRTAVREAWAEGQAEADRLYADNVSRMVRTYKGIMLYHLLTAQHLLSKVNTASADLGLHTTDGGNKLHIGQKVYRITAPSRFIVKGNGGK